MAFFFREWKGIRTSNSSSDQLIRLKEFLGNTKRASKNHKEMWIIRDLNLNWSHFYTDEATNRELIGEVKKMMMNEGMTQVI